MSRPQSDDPQRRQGIFYLALYQVLEPRNKYEDSVEESRAENTKDNAIDAIFLHSMSSTFGYHDQNVKNYLIVFRPLTNLCFLYPLYTYLML